MGGLGAPKPVFYSLADELDGLATLLQASNALFGAAAVPFYDIANAEVLFSFGANLLETWLSPVSQSRSYAQMRRQGLGKRGYFVQFEARMSSTAASADEWIAVRPGTEGLVALALGKMISEATGQHQEWYEEVDPAGMADASGVPLEDLERLASIFSRYERSVAIPGATLAGQQNSLAALTATHALNLLANRLGKAGGVFISTSSVPSPATFVEVQELVDRM